MDDPILEPTGVKLTENLANSIAVVPTVIFPLVLIVQPVSANVLPSCTNMIVPAVCDESVAKSLARINL